MEFKKEHIGSRVYVREMKRSFVVNEENKEVFFRFAYFNLFEDEYDNKQRGAKHDDSDAPGTDRSKSARIVPVQVHPRRNKPKGSKANTRNVE